MRPLSYCVRVFSVILVLFLGGSNALAVWEGEWCVKDPYPDYAPSGVPDFDQHYDGWGKVPGIRDQQDPNNNPNNPAWKWTWDGPVAWVNSLWWMDSRFESHFNPFPEPPPAISDSFSLITFIPVVPTVVYDDHDPRNVPSVVEELARNYFFTDGIPWCSHEGTHVMDMVGGLEMWLNQAYLGKFAHDPFGPYFVVGVREYPALYEIVREVKRCQDVVLLLGLYEENPQLPGEYLRGGGHYVTVAAVDTVERQIRICDPFLDVANPAAVDHSDAANVSHDQYTAKDLVPKGCALIDYPFDTVANDVKGVNPSGLPDVFIGEPGLGRLTLVEYMIHLSPECDKDAYEKPPHVDYAPSGVPDFDQRQDQLGKNPDNPAAGPQEPGWHWTWCGPVAVANSLWWMDSKMEDVVLAEQGLQPAPPPDISDHYPLVESYQAQWDDHAKENVPPFIKDVAAQMKVDGDPFCAWLGTRPGDLLEGTLSYLRRKGLYPPAGSEPNESHLEVELRPEPTFEEVAKEVCRCQDVILLLGFYQYTPDGYERVGGHYVTCAGVDRRGARVILSDPFLDAMLPAAALSGKEQPLQWQDPEQHNDAGFVSHEDYHVGTLSDEEIWLTDYPWSLGDKPENEMFYLLLENFKGANPPELPPLEITHSCEYITKVEYMLHISPILWYWKPPHHDYAQAGVPDFCQKQDRWGKNPQATGPDDKLNDPGQRGWKWTWCGPVAVANSLWWMDSKFEDEFAPEGKVVKPPTASDHFPLMTSYVATIPEAPPVDDHDPMNVVPFVEHLASYIKTDGGKEQWCQWDGTRIEDMVEGIRAYIKERGLEPGNGNFDFGLEVGLTKDPDFIKHITAELQRCQDVILLLGFYRLVGGDGAAYYQRVGGHFVTAAGVSKRERLIGISDPWLDTVSGDNGPSGPGRFGIPHDPVVHDPIQHNDADFVSHDVYQVGVLSDGENYLVDYPWSDTGDPVIREALEFNFWGVNKPMGDIVLPDIQPGAIFLTKIEYMVHVSPVGGPVAVAQVNPPHAAVNQMVTFDGTASYHTNPARSIVKYEWDFDGDGTYDALGPVVTHSYPKCLIYHGSLRVTDDDTPPATADSFFDVFVDVSNHPPVADANGPYVMDEGQDLVLDGSGSYDPDAGCGDHIVSYRWDLDNDGNYDEASGVAPTIPWAELSGLKRYPDSNPIGLKVADLFGDTDTDTTRIVIYVNEPVAVAMASPNPAEVGQPVTLDGSGSYHKRPDRHIVSYEWDLDGDSVWDATGVVVTHSFGAIGTYDVTLRVTDNNSPPKTDKDIVTVKVLQHVPPQEIAVGLGAGGHGRFEMVDAKNYVLTHNVWKSVPWIANRRKGIETRPALGDLDGDGQNEIVVGLGGGGGGRLALFEDRSTGYAFTGWLVIPWPAYNAFNGETWPACGDVDADGKDETVVGLGPGGGGWFFIFDDAGAGYALMAVRHIPPIIPSIVTAAFPSYNAAVGETRPAVGDVDGDDTEEIVIGLGPYPMEGGWMFLFDGAPGFALNGARRLPYPAYNSANGETWPVTGDVDGDAREEIIAGLGASPVSGGLMAFFDDTVAGGFLGWKKLPGWSPYHATRGETHPATSNLDSDASAELVVGLGHGGLGIMWIADDWGTGVAHRGWYWIPWLGYALHDGLSYPRGKALTPLSDEPPAAPLGASTGRTPPEPHESLYGRVSGTVSSGANPVPGAWVSLYDEGDHIFATRTDASGNYLIEGLPPGKYYPLADPRPTPVQGRNLAPEYYDNVPGIPSARGSATPVEVYAGIETSGIDFDLPAGGSISGAVTTEGAQAVPLAGAIVTAYVEAGSWEPVTQTETNGEGNYAIEGLPEGTYYLEAVAAEPGYLGEYYDNVPAVESNQGLATGIAVSAGEAVSGKDFALGRGSSVSGTVTDETTRGAIEGATVVLYEESGGIWTVVATTFTDASGDYEFAGLPAGTYHVEANHAAGGYAGEYYNNVPALRMKHDMAMAIGLSEGEAEVGKDFALAAGGTIAGRVTDAHSAGPLEGVVVTVYEDDFGAVVGRTTTNSNGDYAVGNLPTGNYRLSADATVITYTSKYYDGQPMTEEGKAASTSVPVTAGATVSNINFALEDRPSISGTVTDDSDPANPIAGAVVTAFDASWEPAGSATTAADGGYEIPLEAGDYYVAAEGLGYAPEYYEEADTPPHAQLVSVTAPVADVDFTLSSVGTIVVISNVESAPFTLSSPGVDDIEDNTGATRIWQGSGLQPGTWTITWGDVPGYEAPADDSKELEGGETVTFFGRYTLAGRFRVNVLERIGVGAERKLRIRWYSEVGKMYRVEATNDLGAADWAPVGQPQPGGGTMASMEIPIALDTPMRFFRVMAY